MVPQCHGTGARCFNPRARGGRDRANGKHAEEVAMFQSTRPRGARQENNVPVLWIMQFQSTRPRGARHRIMRMNPMDVPVSIHAPAGGATCGTEDSEFENSVSIHAPAGGATWSIMIPVCPYCGFNPRARGGRDRVYLLQWPFNVLFQSTRPRGARHGWCGCTSACAQFQSTRPRGARRRDKARQVINNQFQSTRPRGARLVIDVKEKGYEMFQSTRPRGARRSLHDYSPAWRRFQSTRPRGARPNKIYQENLEDWFQSTRPRGARRWKSE